MALSDAHKRGHAGLAAYLDDGLGCCRSDAKNVLYAEQHRLTARYLHACGSRWALRARLKGLQGAGVGHPRWGRCWGGAGMVHQRWRATHPALQNASIIAFTCMPLQSLTHNAQAHHPQSRSSHRPPLHGEACAKQAPGRLKPHPLAHPKPWSSLQCCSLN